MKYSKILDHVDSSNMRDTHAKKLAEKKRQEDKIIADKEYIRNVMNNIKSDWKKELDESIANSTTGVLGARVIQSAGDADLEVVQTGLTGDGGIDYGADGYALSQHTGNSTHTGDGEYTGVTAWEPTDSAPDPTGVGTRFRALDAFGILQWTSMDLFMKNLPGYKGGVGGVNLDIGKNYVVAGVGPYGHLMNPEYGKFGNIYGDTVDELGKEHPGYNNTDGLHYKGHGAAVIFKMGTHWAPLKPIDTSEYDTIKLRARVAASHIRNPADAVQLYYWAGDKPGFQSLATPLLNQDVPHDGWRPIYQKPDGTIDTSVSHVIIPNWQARPNRLDNDGKLADYSQKIPEWCRGKNTRFIIYSQGNEMNSWAMTSVRFQRKNDITVGTPLDSPEASSFIRVGQGSADTTPEQRKKKIEDMLKASRLYLMKVLGYADFPGMSATLDTIAASPVGFHKIYDTHAATLSPEQRREFFKNVSDRSRGTGKWRDKVKDPGSNLYKSRDRDKEKYFYKTTSKDSRGMTKTAISRTPESVAAWEKMKKEQQRKAAKGGSKRSGKYENSSYEYENQNLLDLKEKASRLFDKPVKKNKLFGHLDVSDLKKTGVVFEDAPANSTGGLYCVKGDRPPNNDEEDKLKKAAEAEEGITDLAFGSDNNHGLGQFYSPDGTTKNNLAHGWGNWGAKDVPTIWWKNAGGHWNWVAYIGNMYTDHPNNGGTATGADGWGVNTTWGYGYPGIPYVGGVGAPSGVMPDWLKNNLEDENGDPIPPDVLLAPPGPPPVIFQGGLGDPDYYPGDPQKNKSKEEEEAEEKAKNDLGVGDEGLESIKNQAEQDSGEGDGWLDKAKSVMEGLGQIANQVGTSVGNFVDMALEMAEEHRTDNKFKDLIGALPYESQIGLSQLTNQEINLNDEDIPDLQKRIFLENLVAGNTGEGQYDRNFWEKVDVTDYEQNYSDENYYKDDDGNTHSNIGPNGEKQFNQSDNTNDFFSNENTPINQLGKSGSIQINIEVNPETGQATFHFKDGLYLNTQSDNPDEVPDHDDDSGSALGDLRQQAAEFMGNVNDLLHHQNSAEDEIPPNHGGMEGYPANEHAEIRGAVNKSFSMPLEEAMGHSAGLAAAVASSTDERIQNWYKNQQQNESYIAEGWASPKHTDVDKDEKKRWFNPKEIHPDYPREAPPEMVDGWHPDLKREKQPCLLRQLMTMMTMKKNKFEMKEYIKITKVDLIKNYRMKDKEIKKFMNTINSINSFLTRNPSALIHAQMRYPKSDPHLAALNYKMDMQLAAADEYIDKQFPENTRLYNKLIKATQRSIKLTDPKTFKDKKGKMTSYKKLLRVNYSLTEYDPVDKEIKNRKIKSNKKSAGRFFRKPKKKTKDDILKDKMAVLDNEMKKTMPDL